MGYIQYAIYFGSADIVVFPPYQIVIGSSLTMKRPPQNEQDIVLISAVTQYINRSPSGHSAIIQREFLKAVFEIPGMQPKAVQYGPYQIVRTSTPVKDPKENAPINVKSVQDPAILVVNPQSSVTHEVLFWPSQPPECVFKGICSKIDEYGWNEFRDDPIQNGEYKGVTIHIQLMPYIYTKQSMFFSYGQFTVPTSCVVELSQTEFGLLRNNGWLAPECRWEGQNVQ
jgi:hypothetical protein